MILLVSNSPAATKAAEALKQLTGTNVHSSAGLHQVRALAKAHEFDVAVMDESSLDLDNARLDVLLPESAVTVAANLVIHSPQRIARMVSLALRRREQERAAALKSAGKLLRSELRTELTGILLSAKQALETPELPANAAHKLQLVCEAAQRIREQLEM